MAIAFNYQLPHFKLKNRNKIVEWLLTVAYLERREINQLDYVFCTDEFLHKLNQDFLHHKTYTDILTFNYSDYKNITAEIYISIERVQDNAKTYRVGFEHELHRVMVHGFLHCVGYNDDTSRRQSQMRKKEDEHLDHFHQLIESKAR